MIQQLVKRGRDAAELDLASGELAAGETLALDEGDEVVAVVLSGEVEVPGLGPAGGRSDPFGEPGHAVYAPPGERLALTAGAAGASVAVVSAAPNGDSPPAAPARIIGPDDQRIATVGTGNWERTVRTMIGPEDPASRLLVGETLNPPGNWSSYPPHKHDEHRPPDEVRLEEIYYFKVAPEGGFGVQLRYGPAGEESFMVREGDVAVIGSGYHPVVAAPGYQLYYLWALAGEGRDMAPWFDPRHAWVQG
jgi:5-deoxy-glucuronate isomerase